MFHAKADTPLADETLRAIAGRPVEAAAVAEAVAAHFGEPPRAVELLTGAGTFHAIFRVELADGGAAAVRASRLERDPALHLDAWAMQALRARGLPSLRVYLVDTSRRLCGFDYEIVEWAPGRTLAALDEDEPRMLRLLEAFAQVLAGVHGIAMQGLGPLDSSARGSLTRWRDYLELRLDAHLAACHDMGAIERGERVRIERQFAAAHVDCDCPALLHGDPGSHNIFCSGERITAVVDWEDALAGDPLFDVASWATFHPERRHAAFLEGYSRARPLPSGWRHRFWLYFLRIALAKTVHRARFGYTDRPGRPAAARRIQLALERLERG